MGQLEDLQVFIRVVEAGGISRAADQLNIAKSAVSRRLSELEGRLNTKLIQRTTRRFHLTEEGQLYYEQAQNVLSSFEELERSVLEKTSSLKGRLSVSIPLSFGILHMHKALDEFKRKYPEIELNIDLTDQAVNMVEQGIDVAFRIGELDDSTLQARKIMPIRLKMCASPSYIQQFSEEKACENEATNDLEMIKGMQILRYSSEKNTAYKVINPQGEIGHIPIKGSIQSNNGDFLMQLAIAGHGLVLLPTFICWRAIEIGQLVEVLQDYKFDEINAYAVYPQNRYLSRNARAFIDYLVEKYGKGNEWDVVYS